MKVALVVDVGANKGRSLTLRDATFAIGRDPGCQLRADSESISRRHCEILIAETGVLLRDLGSTNGTFINGEQVRGAVASLNDGDLLVVGPLRFRVRITEEAKQATEVMAADITANEEAIPEAPPRDPAELEPDTREMAAGPPTVRVKAEPPSAEGISKAASDLIKKMLAKSPRRPRGPGAP